MLNIPTFNKCIIVSTASMNRQVDIITTELRNTSYKFRGPSVTSVQLRDEFAALTHSIPGCSCSAPHWIQRSDIYLPAAQCIFSKFCSPSNHLPHDFSSLLLLEEDCSLSCVLPLSNSEPEMGEQKEQHTVNICCCAAFALPPTEQSVSSISGASSAHHFGKRKIPQEQTVLCMSGS